jgi:BirA family transcriptional regulator, biotin operon repressor / biotin---[acetyl-CoA-carboxylase] ligase
MAGALTADAVRVLLPDLSLWSQVSVVASTGSTNADLLAAARAGGSEGMVLVAEEQTSGRGRLGRAWVSEPGGSLTFSVLVRPSAVPPPLRGWLPLLAGVAVAAALRAETAIRPSLKWPNDVIAGQSAAGEAAASDLPAGAAKLAGILAEQAGDAVVIGIGLNVAATRDQLPTAGATSLGLLGALPPDRSVLLAAILRELERWYRRWAREPSGGVEGGPPPTGHAVGDGDMSGLREQYLRDCATIGRQVRVEMPGGGSLAGLAIGVDELGRLLLLADDGEHAVSAGDVKHVR